VHYYRLIVRGYELDSYNHVNNAVYLNYLEQARWEIINEKGLLKKARDEQLFLVVVEIKIRFKKEARLFDELLIKTILKKESPYLIFDHSIYNEKTNEIITVAMIKTIFIDKNKIPYDIPDSILTN
jgi:YbgC/YbaW family acyl-CoA thioester hydrolase